MKKFCFLAFACALILSAGATRAAAQSGPAIAMSAAAPTFDYKAKFLDDMKDLQTKFVGLAQATPQDKYTWRPGDGVRSISEVFLHVAGGNYVLTSMMGAPPAAGYSRQGFETSTTDKAAIVDQLNKSFAYMLSYVQGLSPEDLQKPHQLFGRTVTTNDVLFTIVLDLHEHLGQQIAYARMNNVVPPWTAERQANQAARGRGNAMTPGAAMRGPGGAAPPSN